MKEIPGFPGYFATIDGRIYSERLKFNNFIKINTDLQGYRTVVVMKNRKHFNTKVHRLVMFAWNGSPPDDKKICVHHIDHNKQNNHASNLQWVSYSENIKFNYSTGGQIGKAGLEGKLGRDNPESRLVKQYHPEDGLIACYWSLNEAAKLTGSHAGHIGGVCRGVKKTHNGFIWRYVF